MNKEYALVTHQGATSDEYQMIIRESTLESGLVVAEELGKIAYTDIPNEPSVVFPNGLIEPSAEEIAKYGGGQVGTEREAIGAIEYGISCGIDQVKISISELIARAFVNKRTPMLAWNDLASDDEVVAFKSAAASVRYPVEDQNDMRAEPEQYGLYL